jgi:hypothetical protein
LLFILFPFVGSTNENHGMSKELFLLGLFSCILDFYNLLMGYFDTKVAFTFRVLLMLFQLVVMLCVSDMQEMMNFVTNSTRMYIPQQNLQKLIILINTIVFIEY